MKSYTFWPGAAALFCAVAVSQAPSYAQSSAQVQGGLVQFRIADSDRAAASSYSNFRARVLPVVKKGQAPGVASHQFFGSPLTSAASPEAAPLPEASVGSAVPAPGFYPADLNYHGGPVLHSVKSNLIFLDNPPTAWGSPGVFLTHLGKSDFIHVVDQYVGATSDNRYTVGTRGTLPYPIFTTLGDNDLLQIVHSAASLIGSGYGQIYHVFLPKGVDYCSAGGPCYSPDNPSTFAFCAFHGSVDFSDIGHVLFSLEPYQNVAGCSIEQPSPNGALVDSTSNVLSHELIEAITDPDLDAWWSESSLIELGAEIGDICENGDLNTAQFKAPVSTLNGKPYEIQFEYSNTYHACANVP